MDRRPLLLVSLAVTPLASACMGVGREPVRFEGQTNLIVWDAEHKVEHFVRDARFATAGKNLGFVAPTPTRPTIEAARPEAFARLAALAPRSRSSSRGASGGGGGFGGGGVSVVEQKVVAGYVATVLKASDPRALARWMDANGYPMADYAVRWTKPYVMMGWYLTAFKVAAERGQGATGPVRMSFRTDAPVNPYSVPSENSGGGGLSLYYVSAGEEQPRIGRVRPWIDPAWRAPLDPATSKGLASDLGLAPESVPDGSSVRFYRDAGFGRPGFDDVFFVPPPNAYPHWPQPFALMGLGVAALARPSRRGRA